MKTKLILAVLMLFGVWGVIACGTPHSQSGLSDSGETITPVYVTMAGFKSCGNGPNGTGEAQKAAELFPLSAKYGYLNSCFDGSGTIEFQSSLSPQVKKSPATDLTSFIQEFVDLQRHYPNARFYLIGHSHGGWLAMQTALGLPRQITIGLLVTIDPIGFYDCGIETYIKLLSPFGGSLAGCQRAPTDISANMRDLIALRLPSQGWRHYYQQNFLPLHSGPYPAPGPSLSLDLSPLLSFTLGGAAASVSAHTAMDTLGSIWYPIEVQVHHDLNGLDAMPTRRVVDSFYGVSTASGKPAEYTFSQAIDACGKGYRLATYEELISVINEKNLGSVMTVGFAWSREFYESQKILMYSFDLVNQGQNPTGWANPGAKGYLVCVKY